MSENQNNRFTFVVSDESLNKYGTRVMTDGIDTVEFEKNPVMFWNHKRDEEGFFGESNEGNRLPVGRWENLRKVDGKLIAEAVLDMNDELGAKLANKIENKFINASSIGIGVIELSDDKEVMLEGQERPTIQRSVLQEISLVDIPANANAMRLSLKGQTLTLKEGIDISKLNNILPMIKLNAEESNETVEETVELGASLGALLDGAIDEYAEANDMTRAEVMEGAGSAAGISGSTVAQIVAGEVDCPPLNRLEGIAGFLNISMESVVSAAESDGCEYDEENRDAEGVKKDAKTEQPETQEENKATVQEQITNALNGFFKKLKASFNLVPKDKEVEKPAELIADYFSELNSSLASVTVKVEAPAPVKEDNTEIVELKAELKASQERFNKLADTVEKLTNELVELKGKKSGKTPATDKKVISNTKETYISDSLEAQFKAVGSQGIFQVNKDN